jgi:hypothetical protein
MSRVALSLLISLPLVALAAGCPAQSLEKGNECPPGSDTCEDGDDEGLELEPARLYVDPPFGVGFECVEIGCEETRAFHVENRGETPLHIELLRLSVDSSTDLEIELAREDGPTPTFPTVDAPIVLQPGQAFDVVVSYVPTDDVSDEGELWIDWYDGGVAYEDAFVERVQMPITTRVLGDAVAQLLTPSLNFGFVQPGQRKVLPVEVMNATEGSAVLKIESPTMDPNSAPNFYVEEAIDQPVYVNPGQSIVVNVVFEPDVVDWYSGLLYLATNDGAQPQLAIDLLGTAIREPFFEVLEPSDWTLDFGELRVAESTTRTVRLRNLGGQPLQVTPSFSAAEALGFTASAPSGTALPTVPPLGEVTFDVTATPAVGGDIDAQVTFLTNDPTLPEDWIDLHVYGVAPEGVITPSADIDLGDVVQGWTTVPVSFFIGNGGTGDLTINAVRWELGSSQQLAFVAPDLPIKIRPEEDPLEFGVFINAQTIGPANGTLLIETDGVDNPILEVTVTASVVSCETGCAVANGIPTCNAGQCEIDSCLSGFHDPNENASDGCECGEDTTPQGAQDIGDFCSSGASLGTLNDDGGTESVTRTGTLHSLEDKDLYYFRGNDTSEFLDDDYRVKVELLSAPAGLEFCVRLVDSGGGCGGENQATCGLRSYRGPGNGIGDDSEDVTVWVRWAPDSNPVCGNYTIRFRANDG